MAIKTEWRDPNGLTGISCLSSDTKPDAPAGSICWETDTGNRFERDGDTWQPNGTNGAAHTEPRALAGERGTGALNNYLAANPECEKAVIGADGVISANPCTVYGVYVNTTCTAFVLYDNASAASGESINIGARTAPLAVNLASGVKFDNGLYADWTDGEVVVFYRET